MYTFKITYIFIIYNLNNFFYCTQYIIIILFFFIYWCNIASLLCLFLCMSVLSCMSALCHKKWSDKDTDCTDCTDCTCCGLLYLKMVIVEITRISAFRGYMTCSTFFFWVFVSDDFTPPSPLGVPPAYAGFLLTCIAFPSPVLTECLCKTSPHRRSIIEQLLSYS